MDTGGKHRFVVGVYYTVNPGTFGQLCHEYLNLYDYIKLTLRSDIKINEVDVYTYSRTIKEGGK